MRLGGFLGRVFGDGNKDNDNSIVGSFLTGQGDFLRGLGTLNPQGALEGFGRSIGMQVSEGSQAEGLKDVNRRLKEKEAGVLLERQNELFSFIRSEVLARRLSPGTRNTILSADGMTPSLLTTGNSVGSTLLTGR